jgi:surfactin synthase thioesterase subunit
MFHSMGAGASMFGSFLFNPPADCDVHCVQLPGRENRGAEPIYTELPRLLDDLERVILPRLDGPFAFYGHSFGGIIAFELARRLRRHGLMPRQFFCSATMAPQITQTWMNRDVMHESTISTNSEQKLIGLMSYIDDVDFVRKILPGISVMLLLAGVLPDFFPQPLLLISLTRLSFLNGMTSREAPSFTRAYPNPIRFMDC